MRLGFTADVSAFRTVQYRAEGIPPMMDCSTVFSAIIPLCQLVVEKPPFFVGRAITCWITVHQDRMLIIGPLSNVCWDYLSGQFYGTWTIRVGFKEAALRLMAIEFWRTSDLSSLKKRTDSQFQCGPLIPVAPSTMRHDLIRFMLSCAPYFNSLSEVSQKMKVGLISPTFNGPSKDEESGLCVSHQLHSDRWWMTPSRDQ
jgi:hypothetical protein